jgi:hypothetical protein
MVDELDVDGVHADLVAGRADSELVVARGQLPDQIRDSSVVGGSRPGSARSGATVSLTILAQSRKNSLA